MKHLKALALLILLAVAPLAYAGNPAVVQSAVTSNFATTSSTVTLTTAPAVGDYVIIGIGLRNWQNGQSITAVADNQGTNVNSFTNLITQTTGLSGQSAGAFYMAKINAASGTYAITVTTSGSVNPVLWAAEVSNLTGAVDVATGAAATSAVTSQSVTQSSVNSNATDMVFALFAGGTYSSGASMGMSDPPSSGYTTLGVQSGTTPYGGAADAGYRLDTTAVTDSASWTTITGTSGVAIVISLKGASGGGGGGGASGVSAFSNLAPVGQWQTVTANTTLTSAGPFSVLCNASSGAVTITLPNASGIIWPFFIKKIDSSANTCTIAAPGTQKIDNAATDVLSSQYAHAQIKSDSSNYWIQ